MSATALIERARIASEALMIDECAIIRAGAPVFNPNTGQTTNTPTEVYIGPCRLRMPSTDDQPALFGETSVTLTPFIIDVPGSVVGVRIGDGGTLVESDDEFALTRVFRVTSLSSESFNFYRSLGCETVE